MQLDQAKARLAEAEASLTKAKQSRAREVARAQLALDESQLKLARLAEARQRNLIGRNAGTREEMDQAEANRKKNEAQVEATRASLDQAEADYETNILAAEANVGSARTAVRNAEIELGYCRMYAPIDGRISRVNLHVGNLVGDGQSSLLATIVKIDPIYAYINVSEYDLLRYRSQFGNAGPAGRRPGVGCRWSWAWPTSGATRTGARSTTRTRASTRGPARSASAASSPTRTARSCRGSSSASASPSSGGRTRCSSPSGPWGPTSPASTSSSSARTTSSSIARSRPAAQLDGLRVVEGKIGPEDRVVVDGLLRARPS